MQLFEYLLSTANKYRSKSFLEFDEVKNEITTQCVDFILHKCHSYQDLQGKRESFPDLGGLTKKNCFFFLKTLIFSKQFG